MSNSVADYVARFYPLRYPASPWTKEEVAAHEKRLGLPLPAAYQAYLLVAGASPPQEFVGSDCHGTYLPKLREWADELLIECGSPFELPKDAIVFMMHQGYQFHYFHADGCSADPPVYHYMEGDAGPVLQSDHFSIWLESLVTRMKIEG